MSGPASTSSRTLSIALAFGCMAVLGPAATATAQSDDGAAERIQFAPGTSYGSVSGVIPAGGSDRYVLTAVAGQTMTVVTASVEQNAVVSVFAPDGTALQPASVPVFVGGLPTTGDYVIEVTGGATGSASTYGLGVHIPGPVPEQTAPPPAPTGTRQRIQFAPGTNMASIDGAVVLGTRNQYVLGAAGGQTMVVHIDALEDNAVFDISGPGGTVLVAGQQQATVLLPVDGDYVVTTASTRGNATYRVTFWIE